MNRTVLVFAPHNDDEVLGVGGTIAKYVEEGHNVIICEVTAGARKELLQHEAKNAHHILGVSEEIFLNFETCKLYCADKSNLNDAFSKVIQRYKPDTVYIPHYGDMHTDHRVVADAAMVAVRPLVAPFIKRIFAYETLSETEWNTPSVNNCFIPNVWSDISKQIGKKITAMECFESQLLEFPHPRSIRAISALAEYRGSTIGVAAAEAFMCIRYRE
ncbi:MAG: PIG-L family deacetylase [Lachnospiraceae bacterium]|nr:PIG-L family deacetylase [Lachnospiraceae bacterium]